MLLPESIQSLINALERLPGIGPKSASRLAFYLLRAPEDISQDLSAALANFKVNTAFCQECFNITEAGRELCEVCDSSKRDGSLICVVEEALDVLALERTAGFHGKYHVLQGVLSPIEGIGPDDLKIKQLVERVARGGIKEVILPRENEKEMIEDVPPEVKAAIRFHFVDNLDQVLAIALERPVSPLPPPPVVEATLPIQPA